MDTLLFKVAGLDVHEKFVMACVRVTDPATGKVTEEIRRFGTFTAELQGMADWLQAAQVTDVAMESTGVFWKPIWNILEGRFRLLLANAHELKKVAGRKSDVKDAQWIAHLLACGLLTPSIVPERAQRELRDLTRFRATQLDERTRIVNRIHKVLEDANVKLASVASDVLGVSGREMLAALVAGEQIRMHWPSWPAGDCKPSWKISSRPAGTCHPAPSALAATVGSSGPLGTPN